MFPLPNTGGNFYVEGKFSGNKALKVNTLDGDPRANRNLNDFPNCPKITIACWIKTTSTGSFWSDGGPYNSIYQSSIGTQRIYEFGVDEDGYPLMICGRGSSQTVFIRGKDYGCPQVNDGAWHSLIFQIDMATPTAGKFTILADNKGTVIGPTSPTVDLSIISRVVTNGKNSNIWTATGSWMGIIDELMAWDRIVARDQVLAALQNPNILLICTTQTPTPTKSKTPTGTPTPTRTPASNVRPVIRLNATKPFILPTTCSNANLPFCLGV
jgi:hypothetical protein